MNGRANAKMSQHVRSTSSSHFLSLDDIRVLTTGILLYVYAAILCHIPADTLRVGPLHVPLITLSRMKHPSSPNLNGLAAKQPERHNANRANHDVLQTPEVS